MTSPGDEVVYLRADPSRFGGVRAVTRDQFLPFCTKIDHGRAALERLDLVLGQVNRRIVVALETGLSESGKELLAVLART